MTSGFCPPWPHPRGHQTCQERQDDGKAGPCECEAHGGHTSKEESQ